MASEHRRKLAAIISADVAGYSRLMNADEAGTIESLESCREMTARLIDRHGGRLLDFVGDELMAEFASAVDSVTCALEIQRDLDQLFADVAEARRMRFRIGINLGDVVTDGERIFGDGVNIAARVQTQAEAGGICISGTVFDQVEGKLDLEFEDLGAQPVKNIAQPVRIYRVRTGLAAEGDASLEARSVSQPPTIAVLAFANMSGDPEQEYVADGIAEDLITRFANTDFSVIARTSSFSYRGSSATAEEIGRELGARYLVEGSVRRSAGRIRVTAQLIDTETGRHIWAESFDRDVGDLLALQDEIVAAIAPALGRNVGEFERRRARESDVTTPGAWDRFYLGQWHLQRANRADVARARELFLEAAELDPSAATPLFYASLAHLMDIELGWTGSEPESRAALIELANACLAIDQRHSGGHFMLGRVHALDGEYDKAIDAMRLALEVSEQWPVLLAGLGAVYNRAGRGEEAIPHLEAAIRLDPKSPDAPETLGQLALALSLAGLDEEALEPLRRAERLEPGMLIRTLLRASLHGRRGDRERAREAVAEVLAQAPGMNLRGARWGMRFSGPQMIEHVLSGLRAAGLPE